MAVKCVWKKVRLLAFHLKSTEKFFTKEVRSLRLFSQALGEYGRIPEEEHLVKE